MSPERKPLFKLKDVTAQIYSLQAELTRVTQALDDAGNTNGCTNCDTRCGIEQLTDIRLPGEDHTISGAQLLARLQR